MPALKYDYSFDPADENNTAAAVASFALTGGDDVLDIGSGPGWVSRYLAAEQGRHVTCLDYDRDALASLEEAGLRALFCDLETEEWDSEITGESFDVVILADVLEHLRRPDAVLRRLRDQGLLRDDGRLVISVPNASHQSVVAELLVGDFRYTETGILDETHIRWFTLTSLRRLLESCGFVIEQVHRTTRILENVDSRSRAALLGDKVRREMSELNHDSTTYQFVVLARPRAFAGELSQRDAEHDRETRELFDSRERLRADLARKEREVEEARIRADEARTLLEEERVYFASELALGADEVAGMQAELANVRQGSVNIQRQLEKWKREYDRLVDPDGTPRAGAVVYRRARRKAKKVVQGNPTLHRVARRVRSAVKGK
ncbi:class I SAM-dependent methyltransferase [Nocardioides alkalitolerans]|uniref:class I SAM-dependent methyltransferase n=1 Tax=Nocardioides alkalitolerans TaxID=281714 RepID=UPI000429E897|nr:class I SAM-dependent methyltransferase [Nocardioides alkalitolerans]